MQALTYHGAKDVRVETMPDPTIVDPDDIVLRVSATAICGSDLHIYRGEIPRVESGDILGHEFMGIVEAAGADVTELAPGDRVVVPFVIACGECFFCDKELFAACERTNTGRGAILGKKSAGPAAALFGYSHLYGGVPGGQAEYVRVPHANVGPFRVPSSLDDERVLFLSDILLQYIEEGRLQPDVIISHRLPLRDAARGYTMFNDKEDACRKVVLTTGPATAH